MKPMLTQATRNRRGLGAATLMLALMLMPSADAADGFSVRAELTPNRVQQTSSSFTLNARLAPAPAEKTAHTNSMFSLTGALSPSAPLACLEDPIFRDGFESP